MGTPTSAVEAHGPTAPQGEKKIIFPWQKPPEKPHDEQVGWRSGIHKTGERGKPIEMDKASQRQFVGVIFDRYKTMIPANSDQELDTWSDWLIKEIATENGIELPKDGNESDIARTITENWDKLSLQDCREETRNAAYFLVEATELEMLASAALVNKDIAAKGFKGPNGESGLTGLAFYSARMLAETIQDRIVRNDTVLNVASIFNPGIPKTGPMRERWKESIRGGSITALDPVHQAYDSLYMKKLGYDKTDPASITRKKGKIHEVDSLRRAFLTEETGVNVHDSLWKELASLDGTDTALEEQSSDNPLRMTFIEKLNEVLVESYGGNKFKDVPATERTKVLVQAARKAMAYTAKEQAYGILYKTNKNTYSGADLQKAEGKNTKLTEEGHKSDEEKAADKLNEKLVKVEETMEKMRGEDKKIADKTDGDPLLLAQQIARANQDAVDARAAMTAYTNGGVINGNQVVANSDRAQKAQQNMEAAEKAVIAAQLKLDAINQRVALAQAAKYDMIRKLKPQLIMLYPTDQGTIDPLIDVLANPPTYNAVGLGNFIAGKQGEFAAAQTLGSGATRTAKDNIGIRKTLGGDVLKFLNSEERNEVISRFAHGEVKRSDITGYDDFVRALGLDIDEKNRILPPERVAKLLITHLGVDRFDPAMIRDVPAAEKVRDELFDEFFKLDEYGRGKVASEIIYDRFKAIRDLADVTADVIKYKRPEKVEEMEERQMAPERFARVLETQNIFAGVNAVVDNAGNALLVGQKGNVQIYEVRDLIGAGRKLEKRGDLGIKDNGAGGIVITNPGTTATVEARQRIMAEFARRQIVDRFMAAGLLAHVENIAGRSVQIFGPNATDIYVTTGLEVARAGGRIPLRDFIENTQTEAAFADVYLQDGGRRAVDTTIARTNNMNVMVRFKENAINEPVYDPINIPDEVAWQPPGNNLIRYVAVLNDPAEIYFERQERPNLATTTYTASTDFVPGLGRNRLTANELMTLTDLQDATGLRRQLTCAFYDRLLRMTPENRKRLNLPAVGVDISVEMPNGNLDETVSVRVGEDGNLAVTDSTGETRNLPQLLSTAVNSNTAAAIRYDQLGANIAAQMANENLMIQSSVGLAVAEAMRQARLNRI